MSKKNNKDFLEDIDLKEGSLRRQLGFKKDNNKKIPLTLLRNIMKKEIGDTINYNNKNIKITELLKKRTNLAITFKTKMNKKKDKK
jgi:hypothetical protein